MEYLFFLTFWGVIVLYFTWRRKEFSNSYIWLVASRVIFSLLFVYVYSTVYSGDLTDYLSIAKLFSTADLNQVFFHDYGLTEYQLLQPRMVFFAKLFFLFYKASFENVYLVSVLFSLIGSILILESYIILKTRDLDLAKSFLIAWFLPTIIFWTSGISKETISVGAFSFVLVTGYFFIKDFRINSFQLFFFMICIFFIIQLRYFYLPFMVFFFWIFALEKYRLHIKFWVITGLIFIAYLVFQKFLMPQLRFQILCDLIYQNYHQMKAISDEGSYVVLKFEDASVGSILGAFLQSMKSIFFFSFKNVFVSLVSIENSFVLGVLVMTLLVNKYSKKDSFWGFYIFSFLLMAGFFTLVSPNLGSLCRYRAVYWVFLLWYLVYKQKSLLKIRRLEVFKFF